jgi:hypothetical protein
VSRVLARAAAAWQRYFFTPAPASDLGLARAVFFTLAFCLYLPQDFSEWGTVAPEFWMPIPLFRLLSLPLLPASVIAVVQVVFKVALGLAAVGLFTRVAIAICFGCSLYLLGLPQNFGQVQHFDTLVAIVCGILAVSRAGDGCSVDAWLRARRSEPAAGASGEYSWPIRAIWVMTAVIFFSAGFAKLRHSGLTWVFSDHLAIVLVRHQYFVSDGEPLTSWGLAIAAYPWAPRLFAAVSLATEVLYPLALFSRRARLVLVPAGIAFLVGIRLLMGPTFEPFVICSVFWVPWSRVAAKVRAARRSRTAIAQPAISAAPAVDPGSEAMRSPAMARTAVSAASKTSPP